MKCLLNLISGADFVGMKIEPTLNGKNRVQSLLGGIISIVIASLSAIGFIYFSVSIIRKDSPIMNTIQKKNQESVIPYKAHPLILNVFDSKGNLLHLNPAFHKGIQVEVQYGVVTPSQDTTYKIKIYTGKTKRCQETDMDNSVWEDIKTVGTSAQYSLCVDTSSLKDSEGEAFKGSLELKNRFGEADSKYLSIRFRYCDEAEDSSCRAFLKEVGIINVLVYQMSYYLEQSDYSSPVKPDIVSNGYQLSDSVNQAIYLYNQVNTIETDTALFLTNASSESYFTQASVTNSIGVFEPKERVGLEITVSNLKISNINQRRYLKLAELLANMAGFAKASVLLGNLLSYSYSKYVYLSSISLLQRKAERKFKVEEKIGSIIEKNKQNYNNFIVENMKSKQNVQENTKKSTDKSKEHNDSVMKLAVIKVKGTFEMSFFDYICALFFRRKNLAKLRETRYLELRYLIESFIQVERSKNTN